MAILDFVPTRELAGFLGLAAALLFEVDGLAGLAVLLLDDIEGLAGLAGSLRDEFVSGFRLTCFLLTAFNEDIFPSPSS